MKVAVLGAGINGVTCALRIKEKYRNFEVVVISSEFTPYTTGDGSGGLWYPFLCGHTTDELIIKWGGETYEYLHRLWLDGGLDICVMPIYTLYREGTDMPSPHWSHVVFGYQNLGERQLEYLSRLYSVKYSTGHTFTTFIVSPPKLISHHYHLFSQAGGKVVTATVSSLRDRVLDEFDIVVNCTGLGARELVPDHTVFPIRGQIFKVIAPWINETVVDETTCNYIIPNAETCVLGGTHQEHDFNTSANNNDTEFILNGCRNMIPGLKNVRIVKTWVGLRPARDQVRVEPEQRDGKLYIHNYGHGGSGLTLFWGCASEVLNILERHMNKNNMITKSKL